MSGVASGAGAELKVGVGCKRELDETAVASSALQMLRRWCLD